MFIIDVALNSGCLFFDSSSTPTENNKGSNNGRVSNNGTVVGPNNIANNLNIGTTSMGSASMF